MPFALIAAALAVATQIAPPAPIKVREWVRQGDYPAAALRNGERGYFVGHISVLAEGVPLYCEPVRSSPFREICAPRC